jgi:hypothetical protein
MEAVLERETSQSDALAAAAPPAPAAIRLEQTAPLATVELQVKADNALDRLRRHLAQHNFATRTLTGEGAAGLGDALQREPESAAATAEAGSRYARGGTRKSEVESRHVEVLVEGSPEQIESLVASFQSDRAYFAEVKAPESLFRNESLSYGAVPTGGAIAGSAATPLDAAGDLEAGARDLAARPESRAAGPQEEAGQQAEATGRAWILSYGLAADGSERNQDAQKAKAALAESPVELGTRLEDKAELTGRSASLEFRQPSEPLAKQLSQPPEEGRVRVRFLLRAAEPQPAAATAEPKP